MELITHQIRLDAAPGKNLVTLFSMGQADMRAYRMQFKIFQDDEEFNYSSVTHANVIFSKRNANVVKGTAEITDNGIIYNIGTTELDCPGPVTGVVQLWNGEEQRLTSSSFTFTVTRDPLSKGALSSVTLIPELESMQRQLVECLAKIQNDYETGAFIGATGPEGAIGPEGKQGAQGPQGERGRGIFTVDVEDGILYFIADTGLENPFEYDENTGILYYKVA